MLDGYFLEARLWWRAGPCAYSEDVIRQYLRAGSGGLRKYHNFRPEAQGNL